MAKETIIVFVYDTACLTDEAEDPVKAVLYFHPSWVSDTQKVALCGQLMGTSYFLKNCFFKPHIVSLQNGKFVLKEFGRFILAVGTDRNISDYLLHHRADLLASLVRFYHEDLQTISDSYTLQAQYKNLGEKLHHVFETYLPILQCSGQIFKKISKLRVPKTASNIFLDAIQTLECCQQTRGVLGGVILYHNKIVTTQLSDIITKQLVLTDPLQIRIPAQQIIFTDFHIPNGVQMIAVYIDVNEYRKLVADAHRAQNLQTMQFSQDTLPFQYNKRKIKRDKSLIFTNIPEESSSCSTEIHQMDDQQPTRVKPVLMRPTHLPLRIRNTNSKELLESGKASINFDESDSYPGFIGRTSICSTPMAENKLLPVENIMSICANPENETNSNNIKILSNQTHKSSLKLDFEKFFEHFMSNSKKPLECQNSLTDYQDSLKKTALKLTRIPLTLNNEKTDVNRNGTCISETLDFIANDDDDDRNVDVPTTSVFNINDQSVRRNLFQEFVQEYYRFGEVTNNGNKKDEIMRLIDEFREFDEKPQKVDSPLHQDSLICTSRGENSDYHNLNIGNSALKTSLDKRLLSLPIKSLADATPSGDHVALQPFIRKQSVGVPVTPLMSKLSVLAQIEDQRSNLDALGTIDIQTPLTTSNVFYKRSIHKFDHSGLQRAELFICGQQNMTLLLLMEIGSAHQQHIVQKMFDICVSRFPHMKSNFSQTLNINVGGNKRDSSYSFFSIDSKWGASAQKGPWNQVELNTLESMHRGLCEKDGSNTTELILRSFDAVFYGYKSGCSQLFYKEPISQQTTGIPSSSDPMVNVTMRAKTHLGRDDHG